MFHSFFFQSIVFEIWSNAGRLRQRLAMVERQQARSISASLMSAPVCFKLLDQIFRLNFEPNLGYNFCSRFQRPSIPFFCSTPPKIGAKMIPKIGSKIKKIMPRIEKKNGRPNKQARISKTQRRKPEIPLVVAGPFHIFGKVAGLDQILKKGDKLKESILHIAHVKLQATKLQ